MTNAEPTSRSGNDCGHEIDKSAGGPRESKGIELDENRPFGRNSAWAPQGRPAEPPPEIPNGSTTDEPTHIGKTQSTTNSQ